VNGKNKKAPVLQVLEDSSFKRNAIKLNDRYKDVLYFLSIKDPNLE